jgi:hypothetical protein
MTSRPTLIQQCLIIFPPALNSFPWPKQPGRFDVQLVFSSTPHLRPVALGNWKHSCGFKQN